MRTLENMPGYKKQKVCLIFLILLWVLFTPQISLAFHADVTYPYNGNYHVLITWESIDSSGGCDNTRYYVTRVIDGLSSAHLPYTTHRSQIDDVSALPNRQIQYIVTAIYHRMNIFLNCETNTSRTGRYTITTAAADNFITSGPADDIRLYGAFPFQNYTQIALAWDTVGTTCSINDDDLRYNLVRPITLTRYVNGVSNHVVEDIDLETPFYVDDVSAFPNSNISYQIRVFADCPADWVYSNTVATNTSARPASWWVPLIYQLLN